MHILGGVVNLGKAACLVFDGTCVDVRLEGVTFKGVLFPSVVLSPTSNPCRFVLNHAVDDHAVHELHPHVD